MGTQTEMRSEPEGNVAVAGPGHIEVFGLVEHPGVPVGGSVEQQELVPPADGLTVKHVVNRGGATHVEHWRYPTNELLDRGGAQELGLVQQQLALFGLQGQLAN